jgi:hypothetical protein
MTIYEVRMDKREGLRVKYQAMKKRLTIQQLHQFLALHSWAHLDANWIPDPTEVFHMSARKLARAVADPKEMRSGIIKRLCLPCNDTHQL